MRPACLDDESARCHLDEDTGDCWCLDPEPEPPARPIETVPTGDLL